MNLHLAILKAFLESTHFQKYNGTLDYQGIKEEAPEIFRLFQCIKHLQNVPKTYSLVDLELTLYVLYPASSKSAFTPIFEELGRLVVEDESIAEYLDTLQQRKKALNVARTALGFAEGVRSKEDYVAALVESQVQASTQEQPDWIDDDLDRLYHRHYERPGLRWSLDSLNKSLGSLRLGNFGFIFARPETGKTTFLASQLGGMALQVDNPIWWFTNEQSGDDILTRVYQSVLNVTLVDLYRDTKKARSDFLEKTKGNIRIVYDTGLNKSKVESLLGKHGAGLIIFDQIDPIKGFKADRDDLELTAIYEWARSLAGLYAPVIGVCQAGQSGDGKRWLTMNDVNNSKTGKQGSADWMMGIGKVLDDGLQEYRYFNIVKNKLQTDSDSDPTKRHAKIEVKIDADRAQYTDV